MIPQVSLIILILASLLLAIFFGGLGSSFLSVDRLNHVKDNKTSGISELILSIFVSKPGIFVTSMFWGYLLSLIAFTLAFVGITDNFLSHYLHIASGPILRLIQLVSALIILSLTLVLLRQTVFRVYPVAVLKVLALPALLFYLAFFLFSFTILTLSRLISRTFLRINDIPGREDFFHRFTIPEFYSPFSINNAVSEGSDDEEPEVKIFHNALEFSKLKVRDCMVPRNEIEGLEVSSNLLELRDKFIESGYSKILVYEETIDNIIGYISSKELFKNPESIKSSLVNLSIVPESMQINKLLHNLIKERRSIALVVDEYGGTSGIVTLEDIMEEIFGEIEDEHDTQEFVERQVNEREFILSGRLEIDYLNEKYKLNIPETEDYDTLAGYIIFHYENIPKLNTNVTLGNLRMRMLKVSQIRIELVHVTRKDPED